MSPEDEDGEEAGSMAEEGPAVGDGAGGTITGVVGWVWGRGPRGVRFTFTGVGNTKSPDCCAGLLSAPSELTSTLSASFTVPSERKACSKSISVRDMRRFEFDVIGCRPPGNDVGGSGRGVAAFRKATVGNKEEEREETRYHKRLRLDREMRQIQYLRQPSKTVNIGAHIPHRVTVSTFVHI
jgi:hypothetical protein